MAEVPKSIPSLLNIESVALLYITKYEAALFLDKGPSTKNSPPNRPICPVNSVFSLLPFLILRSNTPAVLFPYAQGKAPEKKSLLPKNLLFNMLSGPPEEPEIEK